jgi:ankyrin repeat protein
MATVLGNEELVKRLVDEKADPRARNDADISALDIAAENGHLAIAEQVERRVPSRVTTRNPVASYY